MSGKVRTNWLEKREMGPIGRISRIAPITMNEAHAPGPIYTCPMHPEIEREGPGTCPICGMALEPKTISAVSPEDDSELTDMTRRLWIGAILTAPVFILAMSHLIPNAPPWLSG